MIFSKLLEVLVKFDRKRGRSNIAETNDQQIWKRRFWDILHYVHTHYHEDISLTSLAKQFHLNASYLSDLFKKLTYQNFVDYLQNIRIRHACVLLQSTEMTVSQIAFEVGYNSYSTFSRVFNQLKGMKPTVYRNIGKQ